MSVKWHINGLTLFFFQYRCCNSILVNLLRFSCWKMLKKKINTHTHSHHYTKNSWYLVAAVFNAVYTVCYVNCLFPLLPVCEETAELSFTAGPLFGQNNLRIILLTFQITLLYMKIFFWRPESHQTSELQLPTQCCGVLLLFLWCVQLLAAANVFLFGDKLKGQVMIHRH